MKTNWLFSSKRSEIGGEKLLQKIFMTSLIIALVLASLPAPHVFAAGDDPDQATIERLETAWSWKIRNVHAQSFFYDHVRLYPADFKDPEDLARAYNLLHRYGFALRRAETIIANRAGFDERGRVINYNLAVQSSRNLAFYLHLMRGLKMKLDAVPRKNS
jgi:hypothetical protein